MKRTTTQTLLNSANNIRANIRPKKRQYYPLPEAEASPMHLFFGKISMCAGAGRLAEILPFRSQTKQL
jgi:hypothetical protein